MLRKCLYLLLLLSMTSVHAQSVGVSGLELDTGDAAPLAEDVLRTEAPVSRHSMHELQPFGANLFNGGFSNDREDGLNPDYTVQPGDQLSVRIWGATQFNDNLTVDHQGNIFIPTVGPVSIAGTRNRDLNKRVANAVSTVFTDNVHVYTSLNGTQPVAVFVTGYVTNPGRFAGIPSNSPLHFIDRAGGINAVRGSYRDIKVLRSGAAIATMDLYEFLLDGKMPSIQFQDGDTIVIGPRRHVVEVSGDVANAAQFEMSGTAMSGEELIKLALINARVGFAGVSGLRNAEPMSVYVPLEEFKQMTLVHGDVVNFRTDQHDQVIVVEVEGSHLGPSRYAVPKNTRLRELLDYIEIDAEMADAGAVSLKRRQIASRQKSALDDSLRRLEARYLTASSQTDKGSAIRTREAELISRFVKTARNVEPNGRLVVSDNGRIANVMLQSGDTITIPGKSDSVLLSGEVLVSQAMLFNKGLNARDYIARSGGFTDQAQTDRIVLVHANGEVSSGKNPVVRAGDEIIVLPKVPVKNLQIAATIVDILYKIAVAAAVAVQL